VNWIRPPKKKSDEEEPSTGVRRRLRVSGGRIPAVLYAVDYNRVMVHVGSTPTGPT
jgi:ribosomal protein L25 (general stress protein Ctc)